MPFDVDIIMDAVMDFIADLSGKFIAKIDGVNVSMLGLWLAFFAIPPVLMCIIPWYDNDDDD